MLITFIMNIVGSFTLSVSIAIAFSCLYIKLGPILYAKKDNERNQPFSQFALSQTASIN